MRLPYEDAAVRGDEPVIRLGEVRGRVARLTRGAEDEQHLALRAELDDRVPLACSVGKALQLPGVRRAGVGHPDVAFAVDVHPVGPQDQPCAEALHHVAVRIQLDDRIRVGAGARVDPAPTRGLTSTSARGKAAAAAGAAAVAGIMHDDAVPDEAQMTGLCTIAVVVGTVALGAQDRAGGMVAWRYVGAAC